MTAVIAGYIDRDLGTCVGGWYERDERNARNEIIRTKIRELSSYHPNAVILAVVQQACGDFAQTR